MELANSIKIICRILPGPHLYTGVETSNVDTLPCWRTKVHRDGGIRGSQRESPVNTPIYHDTTRRESAISYSKICFPKLHRIDIMDILPFQKELFLKQDYLEIFGCYRARAGKGSWKLGSLWRHDWSPVRTWLLLWNVIRNVNRM